ncbi:unnamed protein product [Rotaria magnacalcarata]|uniref:Kinesin-like protein n=1 Tax=Rotaria magnacalcarata TaxID=392030 RepID=A0A816EY32_9BILA|nr:unnamed protein product [Rotaria magnacalcarata]
MVKQTIQIFCRIKPTKSKTSVYEVNPVDDGANLSIVIPKDATDGYINNKREDFRFRFRQIFDQSAKQEDVFSMVARPVIDNVIAGYNGTIFAYGQTGSGKTFTITGGPERYADRGIIPRSLSHIFQQFGQNSDQSFTVHVSYLEIYNENGYDLLDPKHEAAKLEDLPKVLLLEDEDQNMHLKNLSIHAAQNEEEALNLLFLGDTNRMIAETPMNQASTRSHCIFTIHITSKEIGSVTVRKAKLHLVDLAGSERVSKSNVNGLLLTEAKYINLSLHYLEQVIVALSEKNRSHIPYRNSMMTSVLRDSLGGNCMTTMIATCSVDKRNIEETISTCRFSQRVALIKNDAILNEELDPRLLINQLRAENLQLRNQISMQNGSEKFNESLTPEMMAKLVEQVKVYLADTDNEATLNVGADMRKIEQCYRAFKKLYLELQQQEKTASTQSTNNNQPIYITHDISPYDSKEVKELKEIIKLRDNEISILVNMLKKEKKTEYRSFSENTASPTENSFSSTDRAGNQLKNMSAGRQEAFDHFRRDNQLNKKLEEHKRILKQRYTEAKTLGEEVNQCRNRINHMKGQYEQMHLRLAAQLTQDEIEKHRGLNELRTTMEQEQIKYRECFNRLKNMKQEIEHIQHIIEKDRLQMLKDFDDWWEQQSEQAEEQRQLLDMKPSKPNGNLSRQTTSSVQSDMSSVSHNAPKISQQLNFPLTGDKKTDDDILAFANARQRILSQVLLVLALEKNCQWGKNENADQFPLVMTKKAIVNQSLIQNQRTKKIYSSFNSKCVEWRETHILQGCNGDFLGKLYDITNHHFTQV